MKVLRLLILTPFFQVSAAAQDIPATLTLDDAIRIARENNPSYRQLLNDPDVDAAQLRAARSRYLPTPSIGLSTSGGPTRNDGPAGSNSRRSSATSLSVGLNLLLLDDGSRQNQIRSARLSADATSIEIAQQTTALTTDIISRYFAAVSAERGIRLEERNLQKKKETFDDTGERYRIARADQIDVKNAQLSVRDAENALARAHDDLRKRKLDLLESMGVSLDREIKLDTVVPRAIDIGTLNADALMAQAMRLNPSMRTTDIALTRQRQSTRLTRNSRWWPQIRASAGYGRDFSESDYGALFNPDLPNSTLTFRLSANYNLPEWFQSTSSVTSADAALEDAQLAARRTALNTQRLIESQLIDLKAAARDLAIAEERRVAMQDIVAIADAKLNAGTVPFFEYQNYLDNAANAERAVLQARLRVITAQLSLEQTVGAPLRP